MYFLPPPDADMPLRRMFFGALIVGVPATVLVSKQKPARFGLTGPEDLNRVYRKAVRVSSTLAISCFIGMGLAYATRNTKFN
jgi:uncharacterized membrane protein